MSDFPRATVGGPAAGKMTTLGAETKMGPHVLAIPGCGDVLFHHAAAVNVSKVLVDDAAQPRIALQLAMAGCDCGCSARGRGLVLTPDVDGAREIARRLITMADEFETAANEAAHAALRKAAGK